MLNLSQFFYKVALAEDKFCDPNSSLWDPGCGLTEGLDVMKLVFKILGIFRTIFWIAAVAMILYAAFLYLSAGMNEKNVEKAKKVLWSAVIAMAIALIATSVPFLVKSLLG